MSELDRFAQVSLEIAAAARAKREQASRPATGECAHRRVHARRPELTRSALMDVMEECLWVFADLTSYYEFDEREATGLEECADSPAEVRARACDMWVRVQSRREIFEQHRREFEYLCHRAGYPHLHPSRLPTNEEAAADTAASDTEYLEEELSA